MAGDAHASRGGIEELVRGGVRPGRSQSGNGDPELHITKAGDCELRRLSNHAALDRVRSDRADVRHAAVERSG
jgi:transposase